MSQTQTKNEELAQEKQVWLEWYGGPWLPIPLKGIFGNWVVFHEGTCTFKCMFHFMSAYKHSYFLQEF